MSSTRAGGDTMNVAAIPPYSEDVIERAAEALYERDREEHHTGPEWDWPNIDRSYDYEGDGEPGPEWLRDLYREQVIVVIHALGATTA